MNTQDHANDHDSGVDTGRDRDGGRAGERRPGDTDRFDETLRATLRAALDPPTDVRNKARHKVDRALHVRSATSLLTSMGGCGIETLRHLLTNPARPADRYSMSETRQAGTPPGEHENRGGVMGHPASPIAGTSTQDEPGGRR